MSSPREHEASASTIVVKVRYRSGELPIAFMP
jgi:hypothetical protein